MRLLGLILVVGGFIIWRWSNLSPLEWVLIGIGAVLLIASYFVKKK